MKKTQEIYVRIEENGLSKLKNLSNAKAIVSLEQV
jgi:hypothetical protein